MNIYSFSCLHFMTRPKKKRCINFDPTVTYFKPRAIPLSVLQQVDLSIDEFESLRLSDVEDIEQTSAAQKMEISQPTFNRILKQAHKKIADAIVNGKAIKIHCT